MLMLVDYLVTVIVPVATNSNMIKFLSLKFSESCRTGYVIGKLNWPLLYKFLQTDKAEKT